MAWNSLLAELARGTVTTVMVSWPASSWVMVSGLALALLRAAACPSPLTRSPSMSAWSARRRCDARASHLLRVSRSRTGPCRRSWRHRHHFINTSVFQAEIWRAALLDFPRASSTPLVRAA